MHNHSSGVILVIAHRPPCVHTGRSAPGVGQVSVSGGTSLQILLHYLFWSAFFSPAAMNCSLCSIPIDLPGFPWGKDGHDPYIEGSSLSFLTALLSVTGVTVFLLAVAKDKEGCE